MMFGMRHFGSIPLVSVKGMHFLSTSAYAIVKDDGSYTFGPMADLRFAVRGKEDRAYGDVVHGDIQDVAGRMRFAVNDDGIVYVRDYGVSTRDIALDVEIGLSSRGGLAGSLVAFSASDVTVAADRYMIVFKHHQGETWGYETSPDLARLAPDEYPGSVPSSPSKLSAIVGRGYWHAAACPAGAWGIGILEDGSLSLGRWMAAGPQDGDDAPVPERIDWPAIELRALQDGGEEFDQAWAQAAIMEVDGERLIVQAHHRRRVRTPLAIRADGFDPSRDKYVYATEERIFRIVLQAGDVVQSEMIGEVHTTITKATQPPPDGPIVGDYGDIGFIGQGHYLTAVMRSRAGTREWYRGWNENPANDTITMAFPLIDDDPEEDGARPFVAIGAPFLEGLATLDAQGQIVARYGQGGWVYYSGQSAIQHDFKVPPVVYARLNF